MYIYFFHRSRKRCIASDVTRFFLHFLVSPLILHVLSSACICFCIYRFLHFFFFVCRSFCMFPAWCSAAECRKCSLFSFWCSRMFVDFRRSAFLHFCSAMFLIVAMIRSESVGGIWAGIAKRNKKRLSASDSSLCFFSFFSNMMHYNSLKIRSSYCGQRWPPFWYFCPLRAL